MTDAAEPPAAADPPPTATPAVGDQSGSRGPLREDIQRPLDESVPEGVARVPAPREPAAESADQEPGAEVPDAAPADAAATPADAAAPADDAAADAEILAADAGDTVPLRPAVPAGGSVVAAPPAEPAGAMAPTVIDLDATPAQVAWHTRRALAAQVVRTLARRPARAGRAVRAWARRPSGRLALPGALIVVLVAAAVSTGAFVIPSGLAADGTGESATAGPGAGAPSGAPGASAPAVPPIGGGVDPGTGLEVGNPTEALTAWAEQMAALTGIPMVAVRAYGYAELVMLTAMPTCHLSWTTLAAIGRVESNHGSSGGATLLPDGRALPAIIGLPLDGQGDRMLITDTDGGQLDGDQIYDRAVGPMQFIPTTWQAEAAPDRGIVDVHNVNDASLAAGYYLCRGRDLATPEGWWAAILSYNNLQSYAEAVFAAANEYGQRSRAA